MENNSKTEFVTDLQNKKVTITREFDSPLENVWRAWTEKDLLDQWWAPKPFMSKTKVMDFKVGGRRFYAMVSPEGQEHWSVQKYTSISPKTNFKMMNAFADKDENPQLPGSDWDVNFSEENGTTKVCIIIINESLDRMKKMIEMGFQSGIMATLESLDELLHMHQ
ncbi:MAG TPA: SRPBCC domain-containing protein [Bacteroidia bacterium]|jgi:uncharacterized protein YndB with AHSA1/START domain|nr:SRPBCC domain-containing protein [Bacteroidia bacterium]